MRPLDYLHRARLLTAAYDKGHNLRARQILEKAIGIFPDFARFYALMSYTYVLEYRRFDTSDPSCLTAAEGLIAKALQLDAADYYVNWSQAILLKQQFQFDACMNAYDRALILIATRESPPLLDSLAELLAERAETLIYLGDGEQAVQQVQRAMQLLPDPPDWYLWDLGWALMQARRYQESLDAFGRIARPHNDVNILIAASNAGLGRRDEARLAMGEFLDRQMPSRPGSNEPVWSIEKEKRASCYKNEPDLLSYLDLLRLAGLPET